jgi:hypothetical protein
MLRISADVESNGYLKVKVLDEHGKLLAESKPLNGSFSDRKVIWPDGFSLEKHGTVQIQFEFKDAVIYSFSFNK